jgi:SSS family solute:Na+ symporter
MSVLAGRGAEIVTMIAILGLVAVLGFGAARWRRRPSPSGPQPWDLEEWGLGGRAFGGTITFFLVGGDLYTAYTLVAVPALVYAQGGLGFFAVSYVAITFPLVYVALPRLWSVAHVHGFVSTSEFVRARFGSRALSVLVAVVAIVGTMPYVALQIVGLQVVFQALGLGGALPLLLAFAFLAFFTFNSGLRAPALLAIVKDFLLLITVLMLLLWLGVTEGGWGDVISRAGAKWTHGSGGGLLLAPAGQLGYVTLILGSALALFLYPHAITGVLAARNRATLKRSMSTLPIYSLMLGVFALFGFIAISAGIKPKGGNVDTIIPQLFHATLSGAALGLAYAALAIGALVPASVMSIGAANVFTRSIYREFIRPDATPGQEARVSRTASLVVKLGAIVVVLLLNLQFAVNLQLMGGVLILQLFPAVALGLYTNWFHRRALIVGLVAGLISGIVMLYQIPSVGANGKITSRHFGGSSWPLVHLGWHTRLAVYAGLAALAVNLAVAAAGTLVCHWRGIASGVDRTGPSDYTADEGDPAAQRMPELIDGQRSYRARHARLAAKRPLSPPTAWRSPLLHEVPGLRGDGQRRRLRDDALEGVCDLGELIGGERLPLERQLGRQVVLPGVHVGQVRAGQRLLDHRVVDHVAVAAVVGRGACLVKHVAGRQVVRREREALEVGHVPVARGLDGYAVGRGHRGDLVDRLGLQDQLDARLRRVRLQLAHL